MMKKWTLRRVLLCLLAIWLMAEPLTALGEREPLVDEEQVKYVATATVALKIRADAGLEFNGVGQIYQSDTVYVIEYGPEWSKVATTRTTGYVRSQYLKDLHEYNPATSAVGEELDALTVSTQTAAAIHGENGFISKYYAYAVKGTVLYETASTDSKKIINVPIYKRMTVDTIDGDWCRVCYNKYYGWVKTSTLFKWDRIDPYAGGIPGLICYPRMAFVRHTTNIYSLEDDSLLKTINPGSALCVEEPDEAGRFRLPYHRTTGYIKQEDIAYTIPVVDWAEAQPGDLISVMTTYYAVGVASIQYQGRNWNIYLAGTLISGLVLQPNDTYNQNKVIGPYSKSTGYHKAPIMSDKALSGYGGGTCQVNTTFYICTIQLPLLVTHRKVHADVGIYYCPQGFDAAVGSGDINLTMRNTLPYAIRYQYFISDGVLTACIYRAS